MVGRKRCGCVFARQATDLVFGLGNPHLDARGIAVGVVGLGVECLDLDICLAFFDVARVTRDIFHVTGTGDQVASITWTVEPGAHTA